ncbi:MAG: ABC transporter ATP-binding protein [Lachnospiraceae bacterium]|nr:ABC transporter ATP-binding protein [Lachnospiraceae bacterium]
MEYAIEVKDLCKNYNKFQLDHVSLQVPCGSIVGFVGENGAGKSTTIKGILGLLKKDGGSVKIFGREYSPEDLELKESIGVVFDGCLFHENLRVREINKIMKNIYKTWEEEKFWEYLKKLRVDDTKLVKELSRGNKMKVSLAVALSHGAKLLILDEATSGLDPMIRDQILDIFLEFIQNEEHSILVSSHIISDLEKVADYIAFIHKGKLQFVESKDRLLYHYGLVRCTKKEFESLDRAHMVGVRKNSFGYEVMVDNRPELEKRTHTYVLDQVTIEEIMLFQTKGDMA